MKWVLIIVVLVVGGLLLLKRFESLKGKSIEDLEAMLDPAGNELFYHNAIVELRKRGKETDRYLPLFARLLASENQKTRLRGWVTLQKLYPKVADNIGYNPFGSSEDRKKGLQALLNANPNV
mgnify:CR=1 FL=1